MLSAPSVNVRELNRMIESKRHERNAAYIRIYDNCQQVVIRHAKQERLRTVFEVPEFILGIPPFNLNEAITFVMERLKKNGFLVSYFFPKLLYISWDVDEIVGKKVVQPIAMSPTGQVPLTLPGHAAHQPRALPPPIETRPPPPQQLPNRPALTMPNTPKMDLPLPIASASRNRQPTQTDKHTQPVDQPQTRFFKSITDYKPSGKFVLDLN